MESGRLAEAQHIGPRNGRRRTGIKTGCFVEMARFRRFWAADDENRRHRRRVERLFQTVPTHDTWKR